MTDHRPCPFCGGTKLVETFMYHPHYRCVKCTACHTHGPNAKTPEEAWRAWDSRQSIMVSELRSHLGKRKGTRHAQGIAQQKLDGNPRKVGQQRRAEL